MARKHQPYGSERRDFSTSRSIHTRTTEDDSDPDSDAGTQSADGADLGEAKVQSVARSSAVVHAFKWVLVACLVSGTVLSATAMVGTAAPADPDSEDALETKQRALALAEELEALDATTEVDVDAGTRESIHNRLQQGNLSFRAGNYDQAISHYQTAIEQAETALQSGYQRRTASLLDAVEHHLAALDSQGYSTPLMARLNTRLDDLRERHETITTLQEARDLHDDAEALDADLGRLPSPSIVQWASWLQRGLLVVALGLAVLIGIPLGARLQTWRRSRAETDDEEDFVEVAHGSK